LFYFKSIFFVFLTTPVLLEDTSSSSSSSSSSQVMNAEAEVLVDFPTHLNSHPLLSKLLINPQFNNYSPSFSASASHRLAKLGLFSSAPRHCSTVLLLRVDSSSSPTTSPAPSSASLQILFLKRAVREGDPFSGHVCFPGGHIEKGETELEGAVREAREECGLDLSNPSLFRCLGRLPNKVLPSSSSSSSSSFHLPTVPYLAHPPTYTLLSLSVDGSFRAIEGGFGVCVPPSE
jgi:8-oxo-dGTP pyrophosphatase MutT (NUDIX family)